MIMALPKILAVSFSRPLSYAATDIKDNWPILAFNVSNLIWFLKRNFTDIELALYHHSMGVHANKQC